MTKDKVSRMFFVHTNGAVCTGCEEGFPKAHRNCTGYLHLEWMDSGEQVDGWFMRVKCDVCDYENDIYERDTIVTF